MFKLLFFLLLQTPASIQPPPGQKLLFKLQGKGNQIYVCQNAVWVFKAPAARLFDDKGQLAGKHFAGPTWEANDGSQVKGKVSATVASPDKQSVPWLLVTAVSHQGTGIMAAVETIQRLETQGGKAPAASCDPVKKKRRRRCPTKPTIISTACAEAFPPSSAPLQSPAPAGGSHSGGGGSHK